MFSINDCLSEFSEIVVHIVALHIKRGFSRVAEILLEDRIAVGTRGFLCPAPTGRILEDYLGEDVAVEEGLNTERAKSATEGNLGKLGAAEEGGIAYQGKLVGKRDLG